MLHSPTNKRFFSGVGGIPYSPSFNEYIFLWKDIWITNFTNCLMTWGCVIFTSPVSPEGKVHNSWLVFTFIYNKTLIKVPSSHKDYLWHVGVSWFWPIHCASLRSLEENVLNLCPLFTFLWDKHGNSLLYLLIAYF